MNIKLMKQVRADVLKDYKHVDMASYVYKATSKTLKGRRAQAKEDADPIPQLSCGTVGCIAGRAMMRVFTPAALKHQGFDFLGVGRGLLGLSNREAKALFLFHANGEKLSSGTGLPWVPNPYKALGEELALAAPGTKQYAKIVAKAIDLAIAREIAGEAF